MPKGNHSMFRRIKAKPGLLERHSEVAINPLHAMG